MAALRAAYPNAMRLDYQPRGTTAGPRRRGAGRAGQALCRAVPGLFHQMNGRPLTIEEARAVKQLREEAAKA